MELKIHISVDIGQNCLAARAQLLEAMNLKVKIAEHNASSLLNHFLQLF